MWNNVVNKLYVYIQHCLPDLKFSVNRNNDVKYIKVLGFINNPHVISIVSEKKDKLVWHIISTWRNGWTQI
jgi:hypothetical protein